MLIKDPLEVIDAVAFFRVALASKIRSTKELKFGISVGRVRTIEFIKNFSHAKSVRRKLTDSVEKNTFIPERRA